MIISKEEELVSSNPTPTTHITTTIEPTTTKTRKQKEWFYWFKADGDDSEDDFEDEEDFDNFSSKKFKLYLFNNEEKFKRKIRLHLI
jgi:hypothetical protein